MASRGRHRAPPQRPPTEHELEYAHMREAAEEWLRGNNLPAQYATYLTNWLDIEIDSAIARRAERLARAKGGK